MVNLTLHFHEQKPDMAPGFLELPVDLMGNQHTRSGINTKQGIFRGVIYWRG